jgi:DNA invertase Pin-like site-specific DNA recombinase
MNVKLDVESDVAASQNFVSRSSKITHGHLEGIAFVYVRQSTANQVLNHRESAARQYSLVDRAVEFGWQFDRVEVIDEDQGQSGATAESRTGFQRLLAEVSLGHVGIILGLELSRLARSNKDWHQLIELCAIFGTILADQDGIYDPTNYNDRLLLGLRGIMNEAELHVLRGRMHDALLSKAKRGEVYVRAPVGYVKSSAGEFELDPDEQARHVIHLIFAEFERLGSVRSVLRYLFEHDIKLPIRPHAGPNKGQLEWRPATPSVVNRVLKHELYAGTYRFGYRQTDPRLKKPGQPDAGRVVVPPEKYHALIPDHCPAYISKEQYARNQERIRENRFGRKTQGAARDGSSILAGLLFCGKCGRRMTVVYSGPRAVMRYYCTTGVIDFRTSRCQSLSGAELDSLVTEKVLLALEPASLEISIEAVADLQQEQQRLLDNWNHRLERAAFAVDRAKRQYQLVEPENRLVVRELERQWESALHEHQQLSQEYARTRQTHLAALSKDQLQLIRSLAENVPRLWRSPTTTCSERQRVVRLLLERVTVTVQGTTEKVDVAIRWAGGFASHHELLRPVRRYDQTVDFERLRVRLSELKLAGKSYSEIATQLNLEGFRPAKQSKLFNTAIVGRLAKKLCRELTTSRNVGLELSQNEWSVKDLSKTLGIPRSTLQTWKDRGWLHVVRQMPGRSGMNIYWADEYEIDRLRRLRKTRWHYGDPPLSKELTTPKLDTSQT